MESFWSMMKRGYHGTYHRMGPTRLQRYGNGLAGRHTQGSCETEVQMRKAAQQQLRKRLWYKDLAVGQERRAALSAIAT